MGVKSAEQGMLEVVSLLSDIQREIKTLNPYLTVRNKLVTDGKVLVSDVDAALKKHAGSDGSTDAKENGSKPEAASKEAKSEAAKPLMNSVQDPLKSEKPDPVTKEVNSMKPLPTNSTKPLSTDSNKPLPTISTQAMRINSTKTMPDPVVMDLSKKEGSDKMQSVASESKNASPLSKPSAEQSKQNEGTAAKEAKSARSSTSTMTVWKVLKKKLPPDLLFRLKSWLASVSQARQQYETNINTLTRILDLVKDLKAALHEYPVLAHPSLVCKVMDYKDNYSKWKAKLVGQQRVYNEMLEQFPENPYLHEAKAFDNSLNHMEEARPFPDAWKRPDSRFFY